MGCSGKRFRGCSAGCSGVFGAGSGAVQGVFRKAVQQGVQQGVQGCSGPVQAPEPPLNTPATCVRFGTEDTCGDTGFLVNAPTFLSLAQETRVHYRHVVNVGRMSFLLSCVAHQGPQANITTQIGVHQLICSLTSCLYQSGV